MDQKIEYVVLGYIRPELNFDSIDELIDTINSDIEFAKLKLKSDEKWQGIFHEMIGYTWKVTNSQYNRVFA